jgi:hypothetical protein
MSEAVFMEYMGFKSTTQGREYAFHVRFSSQDSRDYTVTIASEAFIGRRVSYQDGPNVCSSRLKRELTANPGVPTFAIFGSRLAERTRFWHRGDSLVSPVIPIAGGTIPVDIRWPRR